MGRRKTRQPARTRTGCKGEQVGRLTETDDPRIPPPLRAGRAVAYAPSAPDRLSGLILDAKHAHAADTLRTRQLPVADQAQKGINASPGKLSHE